jgi:hypothetical protein
MNTPSPIFIKAIDKFGELGVDTKKECRLRSVTTGRMIDDRLDDRRGQVCRFHHV